MDCARANAKCKVESAKCKITVLPAAALFNRISGIEQRKLPCMDIQIATLCDAANDSQGKLNILGAFDTLATTKLPAAYYQCCIALRMTFDKGEEGTHKLKINIVDEDGKPVMPSIEIGVEIAVPDETMFLSRNFILNIQQLTLPRPGLYSIDVFVDNQQKGSIPLHVRLMQMQQQ